MRQPSQQAADPAAVAGSPNQVKQEELQPPTAPPLEHRTAVNTSLMPPPQQQQQQQSFDAGQLQLRVPELLSLLRSCYASQQWSLKHYQASLNNWAKICGTDDLIELIRIGPEVLNSGLQDNVQRGQLTARSAAQYLSRIIRCLNLQHVRSMLMCQSCAAAAEQQLAMQCSGTCATGWQQLQQFTQQLRVKRKELFGNYYKQQKQDSLQREFGSEADAQSDSSSDDDAEGNITPEPARKRQRLLTAGAGAADYSVYCMQATDHSGAAEQVSAPALSQHMQQQNHLQQQQQQQQQQQAALSPCTALPYTVLQQPAMHISLPTPAAAATTGGSGGDMCGLPGPNVSLVKLEPANTPLPAVVSNHQEAAVMSQQQTVQQTAAAAPVNAEGQQLMLRTLQKQPTVQVKSEPGQQDSARATQGLQQQQQQVNNLAALPVCQHIKIEPVQSTADDHHAQGVPEAAAATAAPATECAAHSRGAHCGAQRMEGMPCQAAPGLAAAAARVPATAAAEPTAATAAAAQAVLQHTSSLPVLVRAASTQHQVAAAVQVDTRTQEAPSSSTAAINNRDSNRREKSGNSSNNNAPCVDDAVLQQCRSKLHQLAEHAQDVGLELVDSLDSFSQQIDRLKSVQLGALLRVLQMLETQVLRCQMLLLQCLLQQQHQQRNIAGSSPAEAPIQCSSTEPPPAAAAAAGSLLQQLLQCWDREVDQTGCTVDLAAAAARQRRVEDFTVDQRGFYIPANAYLAGLCELSMQLIVSCCCCCELDANQESADGSRVEQLKHLAAHIVAGTAALLSNGQLVDQPAEKRTTKAMFWRGWLYRQCRKCNASSSSSAAAAAAANDCIIAGGSKPGSISARQISAMNSQVEQEVMKVFDTGN